ncbi:6-pyruvoyl tetrahydrobiopterin synthase [Achromatium sp. WMS1]|nr:6-pyruvoyl tetrahydrobiopterin synthase [Achromatium sp. WMS1]
MYNISKEIHFCYGHRLLQHKGACKHLHGHSAKALIRLGCETLNEDGMVCDFADLGSFVKTWLQQELDHTLLLYREDPLVPILQAVNERYKVLDCHPTAENIARLIFEAIAQAHFPVLEVTIYETYSASATFTTK